MPAPLLKASDVAERLSISPRSVYSLASRGLLPAVRLGSGMVRFEPTEIERVVAAGGVPSGKGSK